jgi:hypothetical protein
VVNPVAGGGFAVTVQKSGIKWVYVPYLLRLIV